ncbi:MAG: thiamine ABC transporter permease [Clostridiales bacterium]|nr:MAG: thiamine ABC transporter permease [Clostridiales bacterium]
MIRFNNKTKTRLQKFLSYYKPYRKIFAVDMLFAVLSAAVMLVFPLLSGYITGEVLKEWNSATLSRLLVAGAVMLLLIVLRVVANVTYAHWGHAMGAKMEGDMRDDLLRHYEKLSFHYFARNSVGKMMTLITNDLTNMTELFHHGPEDLVMTVIKFFGAFFILIQINVPLTLIVFAVFPLLCFNAVYTDKKMQKALLRSKSLLGDMNEQLEDTLAGIRTVKAFGSEQAEFEKFSRRNRAYVYSLCHFYKVEARFYEVVESYPQLLIMLVVVCGALLMGSAVDLPVLITFLLYVSCLSEPIHTILNFMGLYERGVASFKRFMEVMELEPAVADLPGAQNLGRVQGCVVLEQVSFRYPDGSENVLENVSLKIAPGEKLAVVGSSGIGKSTLSYLLARFYDVTSGSVKIDGNDVRSLTLASLRENIGIVQQEVTIFSGTIRENIAYGLPEASSAAVEQAAVLAGAHEFVTRLENGYDTVVGTKGITLSGGQRQRISLARVFLKNPPILILDEATSALDSETERNIQTALDQLMSGRTSVVIAHRLSTIRNADRIVVLKDKQICEQGTHPELLQKNGEYARLYRMALA